MGAQLKHEVAAPSRRPRRSRGTRLRARRERGTGSLPQRWRAEPWHSIFLLRDTVPDTVSILFYTIPVSVPHNGDAAPAHEQFQTALEQYQNGVQTVLHSAEMAGHRGSAFWRHGTVAVPRFGATGP